MHICNVVDGGFSTTVQDLGRYGYQRFGVPVSGAMDLFAFRAANILVGNPQEAAALEITLLGPRLQFLCDTVLALTGADLEPRLDNRPIAAWRPVVVPEGSELAFGRARDGLRAYLAIAGGVDVPLVLGSRSTFVRAALGGLNGRPLRSGDRLHACGDPPQRVEAREFPHEDMPFYGRDHRVRVVLGPQDDAFSPEGIATFLSATYTVSPKSDRIGCRLEGPRVQHRGSADIVSDGIPFGAVQVAGDGFPIVLVADRGTTGGYTKLATVISADLPLLAQAVPGDRVGFREVSLAEAHRALHEQEAVLERLSRSAPVVFARKHLHVRVDRAVYAVTLGLTEVRPTSGTLRTVTGEVQATRDGKTTTVQLEIKEAQ